MKLTRCHHHGFTVADIERSLVFYRDGLGLEVVRVSPRRDLPSYDAMLGYDDVALTVALLRHPADDFLLELIQYERPEGKMRPLENAFVGASHLAFEVEDVDALFAHLRGLGFDSISEPVDIDRDGVVVARGVYALDPDGISVELFQEITDVVSS